MENSENTREVIAESSSSSSSNDPPMTFAPLTRVKGLPDLEDVPPPSPLHIPEALGLDVPGLESFSQSELYEMNQHLYNESLPSGPLIDEIAPMSVLRAEYENGSPSFLDQIDWLYRSGYRSIRRARRDGDCFYRSLGFAYVERILLAADHHLTAACAKSTLEATLPLLSRAGFEEIAYDDPYRIFISMIDEIVVPGSAAATLTPQVLLQAFQNSEVSNSVILYLRLLTSAQIRDDPDSYAPFLFHPETGESMQPREFCEYFVDSWGKEADHVQITALSRALKININIAYLDGRGADGRVDFVEFRNAHDPDAESLINLLYRPGHYDILVKEDADVEMK